MKLTVSLLLSSVLGVLSNTHIRPPTEIRQFNGYSNNIIHEIYPDQTAQSTVKVNYSPNQLDSRQIYNHFLTQQKFPQEYAQTYPTNPPQSQLFNVGYSVTFTNNNPNNRQPKYPSPKYLPKYPSNNLDDGEIITGTRKQNEEVQGPNVNMSPQEFVTTSLIASKKQKISGIKPKPHFISNYPNPKVLLSQANLSPNTQKFYKAIEQAKPQIQNTQDLQQKYSWRNLSPGVEIIRSTEVPVSQKYTRPEPALFFDHAKALGRSQEFDYTNVIDNNIPQQSGLFYNQLKKPQSPQTFASVGQNVQKIAVDTILLREPVQVDLKLMEEAARNQAFANNKYTQVLDQENNNYLQQTYRTIPVHENTQNGPPPQVAFQRDQSFLEYQPNNRFQYKIYGKPQPVGVFSEQKPEHVQRQPRFLSNINTNLRPPPVAVTYQRRIHAG